MGRISTALLAVILFSCFAAALTAAGFRKFNDPGGRYAFEHPLMWRATPYPNGRGVALSVGQGYVSVMLHQGGGSPQSLVNSMASQLKNQWRGLRLVRQGPWKHRGLPAFFLEFTGVNPKGVNARSQIMAVVAGKAGYVLMCSAPQGSFGAMKQGWDRIVSTFAPGTSGTTYSNRGPARNPVRRRPERGRRPVRGRRPAVSGAGRAENVPTAMARPGKVYRHPIGFSVWHPAGWQIRDLADTLQFVPPNAATIRGGPAEFYYILGDSAEGITRPEDPQVAQYLEGKLRALIPNLRRKGGPNPVRMTSGRGAGYVWAGTTRQGIAVEVRAYAAIIRRYGVALVGIGLAKHLNRRKGALEAMFASFSLGRGSIDRRLAGTWHFLKTHSLYNDSVWLRSWEKASAVSDSNSTLVLRGDGSWNRTETSHMLAGAGGIWLESKDRSVTKGRWSAGNGVLYLIRDDQTWESYHFRLKGTPGSQRLALKTEKKVQLWKKVR